MIPVQLFLLWRFFRVSMVYYYAFPVTNPVIVTLEIKFVMIVGSVYGRHYVTCLFLFLERDSPTTTFTLFFCLLFVFCFRYLHFATFAFQWNMGFAERLPLLIRHESLLLEYFLFYFNDFTILYDYRALYKSNVFKF